MGLLLQNSDERTQLQSRLAAELREKVKIAQESPGKKPEVEPELLADGEQTRPAGMIILALSLIILIAIIIWIALNF